MATDSGGGGAKRSRVDEQGDRCDAVDPDAALADRISALPDEVRQRILTHLPLRDAIRTGAVARGWRGLWKSRWAHRSSVEIHLSSRVAARRELDALSREPRPRRRLDCFSLVADTFKSSDLRRFIEYSAECRVEDLHVELQKTAAWDKDKLAFRLSLCNPLLVRLSLCRICIADRFNKRAQPFRALEVIQLQSVSIYEPAFGKMMALCPSLLTLYLRDCNCAPFVDFVMPPNLRNVTMANCVGRLNLQHQGGARSLRSFRYRGGARSLRSFRYRGDMFQVLGNILFQPGELCNIVKAPFYLPLGAVLADLYIQFAHSDSVSLKGCGEPLHPNFNNSLPKDLSGLNVLTICCKALQVVFSLTNDGANAHLLNLNLLNLRELQLLMLEMEAANLADIYLFLKIWQCPNLERLFVQLPEISYPPMEGSTDDVCKEPPFDGLDNLAMVKVMNFNWRCAEVQLVSFLLRKAKSLKKLLIVSPNVTPLNVPGVQESDLLFLKEALANGRIMLSEFDDAAPRPYHSEV